MEGSPRGATLTGLMLLAAGLVVFLCATNVIPTDDKSFGAPRRMVAAIGLLFLGAGVYVFLMPYTTEAQKGVLGGAIALAFFSIMGILLTCILLTGRTGRGSLGIAGIVIPLPDWAGRWFNRIFVGAFALGLDAVALWGWWRVLTNRWRPLVVPPRTTPPPSAPR